MEALEASGGRKARSHTSQREPKPNPHHLSICCRSRKQPPPGAHPPARLPESTAPHAHSPAPPTDQLCARLGLRDDLDDALLVPRWHHTVGSHVQRQSRRVKGALEQPHDLGWCGGVWAEGACGAVGGRVEGEG